MDKQKCLEVLSNIIADGEIGLQFYTDKRDIDRLRDKIDALKYAKELVEKS